MSALEMVICITGYHDQLKAIIDSYPVSVYETLLDQDVVQYNIELPDDDELLDAITPLQYQALQIVIPFNVSIDLPAAKEMLTVLISRILGARVVSITHLIRNGYLFLTPRVGDGYLLYRSREVIQDFHSRVDPNLLVDYRVLDPHPMVLLAVHRLGRKVRWVEDIAVIPLKEEERLDVHNLTLSLLSQGWRLTYDKVPLDKLRAIGEVEIVQRGHITVTFYKPDPILLLSNDQLYHLTQLTITGPWMAPVISDTIMEGGGIPSLNPIGTVSGVSRGANRMYTETSNDKETWDRIRAKLQDKAKHIPGARIDPTLALVIPFRTDWKELVQLMNSDH